jgi:hypothetical protein
MDKYYQKNYHALRGVATESLITLENASLLPPPRYLHREVHANDNLRK